MRQLPPTNGEGDPTRDDPIRKQLEELNAIFRQYSALVSQQIQSQEKNSFTIESLLKSQTDSQKENTSRIEALLNRPASTQSQAIADVARVDPRNIQEVAASQLAIVNSYYESGLGQSQRSFRWSLIWSGVGFCFFLAAVGFILLQKPTEIAIISAIGGAIIEILASTHLIIYRRATDQLALFRSSLESTQWILLANSMCEKLEGEASQKTRADIISRIVDSAVKHSPIPLPQKEKTR